MATPADVVLEAVALVNEWHEQARDAHGGRQGRRGLTPDVED